MKTAYLVEYPNDTGEFTVRDEKPEHGDAVVMLTDDELSAYQAAVQAYSAWQCILHVKVTTLT